MAELVVLLGVWSPVLVLEVVVLGLTSLVAVLAVLLEPEPVVLVALGLAVEPVFALLEVLSVELEVDLLESVSAGFVSELVALEEAGLFWSYERVLEDVGVSVVEDPLEIEVLGGGTAEPVPRQVEVR